MCQHNWTGSDKKHTHTLNWLQTSCQDKSVLNVYIRIENILLLYWQHHHQHYYSLIISWCKKKKKGGDKKYTTRYDERNIKTFPSERHMSPYFLRVVNNLNQSKCHEQYFLCKISNSVLTIEIRADSIQMKYDKHNLSKTITLVLWLSSWLL